MWLLCKLSAHLQSAIGGVRGGGGSSSSGCSGSVGRGGGLRGGARFRLERCEAGNVARKLLVDSDLLVRHTAHFEPDLFGHALSLVRQHQRVAVATLLGARVLTQIVILQVATAHMAL